MSNLFQDLEESKVYIKKCCLKAFRKQIGGYVSYVFENLECYDADYKYLWITRFPNWGQKDFTVGDTGFLKFKIVEAGKDEWYDKSSGDFTKYNYSNFIFLQFMDDTPQDELDINQPLD